MSHTFIPERVRQRVADASRFRCGYCLTSQRIIGPLLEIEHIVPEARGGTSEETNLFLACPRCNGYKSDRIEAVDPDTGKVAPLFNPRIQRWEEHFGWVDGGALVRGKTPEGRATVAALSMNNAQVVAARRLWCSVGWHPPID